MSSPISAPATIKQVFGVSPLACYFASTKTPPWTPFWQGKYPLVTSLAVSDILVALSHLAFIFRLDFLSSLPSRFMSFSGLWFLSGSVIRLVHLFSGGFPSRSTTSSSVPCFCFLNSRLCHFHLTCVPSLFTAQSLFSTCYYFDLQLSTLAFFDDLNALPWRQPCLLSPTTLSYFSYGRQIAT